MKILRTMLITLILLILGLTCIEVNSLAIPEYQINNIPFTIEKNEVVKFENALLEQVVREIVGKEKTLLLQSDLLAINKLSLAKNSLMLNNNQFAIRDLQLTDIQNFIYLKHLRVNELDIYQQFIDSFPYLEFLELTDSTINCEINKPMLKKLALINCNITCLKPIIKSKNIEQLYLNNNNLVEINEIKILTKLNKLSFCNNKIIDITSVSKLKKLKQLNLANNQITNTTPLNQLINLEVLNLSNNKVKALNIDNCLKLKELDISYNSIKNISPIKNLSNLEWLNLINNNISDIDCLNNLQKLKYLGLEGNNLTHK